MSNPRSRLLLPLLACALTLGGFASTAHAFDVRLVPSRIFAGYTTYQGFNSGAVLITASNTVNTPLILPCYTTSFGSQVDIYYHQGVGTIYPQQYTQLMHLNGTVITSKGYSGNLFFDNVASDEAPMNEYQVQTDGQSVMSNFDTFRNYMFQPGDIPVNETLRWRTTIRIFTAPLHGGEVPDSPLGNNVKDIYIRRVCP